MQDVARAIRGLARVPVFTAVAILSLALAIGASAAIFSVVDGVLLRPPRAIASPERLLSLYYSSLDDPAAFSPMSWPDYLDIRRDARSFTGLLAYLRLPMGVDTGDRHDIVSGELVSENYLRVLGTPLRLGRDFGDHEPEPVALISETLWRERFGGDRRVVGRTLRVGGTAFTVIGVVPLAFQGIVLDWGERPQIWIPMRFHRDAVPALARVDVLRAGAMRSMLVTGRLAQGVERAAAATEIEALARRIARDHPERTRGLRGEWALRALPLSRARFWPGARARIVSMLLVLVAVAASVLVVACANVASLLLARGAQREREIGVRLALGAGARAVLRLLLAESGVIAAAGCLGGLLVAIVLTRGLATLPALFSIPLAIEPVVDVRVVAFGAILATLVSVLVGAAPLRHWLRRDLVLSLRGAGVAAAGVPRWHPRHWLIAAQMAICLTLLVQAGLFVRTFQRAAAADPFLRAGNVLIGRVDVRPTPDANVVKARLARDLPEHLLAIPSVEAVGLASVLPMSGTRAAATLEILDPVGGAGPLRDDVEVNAVTTGFFDLAGSVLLRGRAFAPTDTAGGPVVAVVNEELAAKYWAGDALGRRFRNGEDVVSVVGVVRDRTRRAYQADVQPRVYFSLAQRPVSSMALAVKTHGDPLQALPSLRAAIPALHPDASLAMPQTLAAYTAVVLAQERLAAWCLGALASIALVLSLCGVYGTIAYAVAQRRSELGLRVALGANTTAVVRAVLAPALATSAAGLLAGSMLSLVSVRVSNAMLFGVSGEAPIVWAAAIVLLVGTAFVSAVVPALLAARIDAARAMRQA